VATTLSGAIDTTLQRVRISVTKEEHRDQTRKYLSMIGQELWPLVPAWFLDRTTTFKTTRTLTVTGASGTFTAGETVTDAQGSPYSATVDSYDATNGYLYIYSENTVTPTGTLTGGSSGATATYSSRAYTRVYRPVSGPVTNWWSAKDESNDRPISIIGPDDYDNADIDRDEENDIQALFVGGLNTNTGYPELEAFPTPGTTGDTIRIRYRIDIAAWTSANDSATLQVLGIPRSIESLLIYGASGLYLEENRHYQMAKVESVNAERALASARSQARRMQGNRRYLPRRRRGGGDGGVNIRVDSSLAQAS
tara:strand:- start:122 stop:1048 length:927 start_codon:yes stop_codon:yes gene_type:complete